MDTPTRFARTVVKQRSASSYAASVFKPKPSPSSPARIRRLVALARYNQSSTRHDAIGFAATLNRFAIPC